MDLSKLTMYEACLLHSRSERVLKGMVSKRLEDWQITRMEWILLATVNSQPKVATGHTMSELASALDVRMSQVTALMTKMVESKLLEQRNSVQDRRTRYVSITKRGTKLLADIEADMRSAMRIWLGKIDKQELAVYMSVIQKLGDD